MRPYNRAGLSACFVPTPDIATLSGVYFGRGQTILIKREKIKRQTIEHRRLQHRKSAA